MKKIIEVLLKIKQYIGDFDDENMVLMIGHQDGKDMVSAIDDALSELETPRWYTPEQWEERTGEPWPENGAVYFWNGCAGWAIMYYGRWKEMIIKLGEEGGYKRLPEKETQYPAVCATEAGPPPDGWRPENKEQHGNDGGSDIKRSDT
jgi:hypothetical protein